jgi:MFS transporter, PAT family, beta-lactamase induction signal transducer AmpG
LPERVTPERSAHPVLFVFMFVPMGISNGYVTVTLGFLLAGAGVGVDAIAVLGNWSLFPQVLKVLAGPLVDTTLSNKSWYLITAIVTGLLIAVTGFVPAAAANMALITIFVFLISVASAFTALAADSIMAHATNPEEKGRAGGWSQAGNLGGSAIGGGLGLWLAQNLTAGGDRAIGQWLTQHTSIAWFSNAGLWLGNHVEAAVVGGTAVGLLCVLTSFALLFVSEPPAEHRESGFAKSIANVGRDLWSVVKSRKGLLALVAMTLPIGAAAMTQLWAAVAQDWHASSNWVVLINGMLGGVITMVGCIVGGWICDRMSRMLAFNLFSLITCACALAAAFSPRTQEMYILYVGLYMLITGFCFAAWGAVVLEAIGKGAAATKYNLLAGIANLPIIYMAYLDGKAHVWHAPSWLPFDGTTLMLLTEAAVPVLGTLALVAFAQTTRSFYKREGTGAETVTAT